MSFGRRGYGAERERLSGCAYLLAVVDRTLKVCQAWIISVQSGRARARHAKTLNICGKPFRSPNRMVDIPTAIPGNSQNPTPFLPKECPSGSPLNAMRHAFEVGRLFRQETRLPNGAWFQKPQTGYHGQGTYMWVVKHCWSSSLPVHVPRPVVQPNNCFPKGSD